MERRRCSGRQEQSHCHHQPAPDALYLAIHHILLVAPSFTALRDGCSHTGLQDGADPAPGATTRVQTPQLLAPSVLGTRLHDLRPSNRAFQHDRAPIHASRQPTLRLLRLQKAAPASMGSLPCSTNLRPHSMGLHLLSRRSSLHQHGPHCKRQQKSITGSCSECQRHHKRYSETQRHQRCFTRSFAYSRRQKHANGLFCAGQPRHHCSHAVQRALGRAEILHHSVHHVADAFAVVCGQRDSRSAGCEREELERCLENIRLSSRGRDGMVFDHQRGNRVHFPELDVRVAQ